MRAQAKNQAASNLMQRVKVYRLNDDGKWDDRGTGNVTVDFLERSEDLGLFVIDEEDNETLLAHRIRPDEIYRRQEDTIISWRDPDYSMELALSFQESTGCSHIWDQICGVQRTLHFNSLGNIEIAPRSAAEALETSGPPRANDETFHSVSSELRELPPLEISTLPLILKTLVESGISDQMRVTELIISDQVFFQKLRDLFRMCEDLEDVDNLHIIFKIVKGIILLNSPQIFERIFRDDIIMDIIGSLEYDPEAPHVQQHRAFLKEHVVFKEAIPIKDPVVLSKIHQTYRLGYLKDVILPRVLDEAAVANLNSIILANNAVVVSLLKDDSTFIQELFARMRSSTTPSESKKNLIFFLHEFCSLSKSLQLVQQLRLFRDLMNEGIFEIITEAMQSQDKRLVLTGTDILILFLNQDPNLLRSYVIRQEGNPLLGLLVKGMITDFGEDMNCQFLEILRSLLDSYTLSGPQRDTIIEIFYERHLDQLIDVIRSSCPPKGSSQSIGKSAGSDGRDESQAVAKPEILSNICELLCFCVLHHQYKIKCGFLLNNVIEKVLFLTRRKEKYLVVAAVRFVRTIVSRNDEQLLRHIAKNNLLKPIVDVFVANGNRYNLLNSSVLELFEYIRRENIKTLITYLVSSFWNQLVKFEHLASVYTLKIKYEQLQSQETCEAGSNVELVDHRKRPDERALEKEEEDYFNEDSDEEDTASACMSNTQNPQTPPVLANGGGINRPFPRPRSGGLVDYDDDDDDEDYNPPPRSKPESSAQEETTEKSHSRLKRKLTSSESLEPTKNVRLDKNLKDGAVAPVCSTSSHVVSHSEKMNSTPCAALPSAEGNTCSAQETQSAAARSCSNCSSNNPVTRQSSGEDLPVVPQNSNSSSEMATNGAKVSGSEPHTVR